METIWESLGAIRPVDLIDIGLVAALLWLAIGWLRTTRARAALVGLAVVAAIYLAANQFDLQLTSWILQGFIAASLIIVVVVFQEDIRRFFERIGQFGRLRARNAVADATDPIVRAVARLAQQRQGALVVIPGADALDRHLDGGIALDAKISEPLLLSLFDPHSPGHDGAVIVEGDRVARFAVHLPLSTDHEQLGQRGTRHAAALGLSELADALCLVVSEERGTVSLAQGGQLRTLQRPEHAAADLRRFLVAPEAAETAGPRWRRLLMRSREGLVAVIAATIIWALAVPGAGPVETSRTATISVVDLPPTWELESVTPPTADVVVSAGRHEILLLGDGEIQVQVNAVLAELGRRTFVIGPEQVVAPPGIEVRSVKPGTVKISLRRVAER